MKLIISLLILFSCVWIANIDSTSPPFPVFSIFVTDFHAIIIKAAAFGEPFNDEFRLSFNALYCEVKPRIAPRRIGLIIKADLKIIDSNQFHVANVTALIVRPEYHTPYLQYLTVDLMNWLGDLGGGKLWGVCWCEYA